MLKRIARRCVMAAAAVLAVLTVPVMAADSADRATPSSAGRRRTVRDGDSLLQVVLPMNTEHVFDFIMDPQRLIEKTEAAAYDGSLFEEGATLFFKRSDGRTDREYSSSSDALTITNTGSQPVEVTLYASVATETVSGLTMSGDREFGDGPAPSLYLALTDGEQTAPIDLVEGASITAVVEGDYSFWLTGAVNEDGDWSEMSETEPKVTVTWRVAPWGGEEIQEESRGGEAVNSQKVQEAVGTPSNSQK